MEIRKIPKPWDYEATCQAVFDIMKPYFAEYGSFTLKISGEKHNAFADYTLFEVTESVTKGWFGNTKVKQERKVARFTYFPKISTKIDVYINDADFTETFKEKLMKIEEVCKKRLTFEVQVQQ